MIEKNIPIPKKRSKRWGKYWELVEQMEVNNSVLFKKHKEAERLRSYMKANKIPYAMRAVEGGWRVWKLEPELQCEICKSHIPYPDRFDGICEPCAISEGDQEIPDSSGETIGYGEAHDYT